MLLHRHLKVAGSALLLTSGTLAVLLLCYIVYLAQSLPTRAEISDQLQSGVRELATEVYDHRGRKVGEFVAKRRYFVPYDVLPSHLIHAFVSAEDKNFFEHPGVDIKGVVRAALQNIRAARIVEGASTITQQLVRTLFLSSERSFRRKLKEILLATVVESSFSKKEIFELYINTIFLGNRSYGIEAAARSYFRKSARELSVGEAAILAGLPKAPSRLAIHRNYPGARKRQKHILGLMRKAGHINEGVYRLWLGQELEYFRGDKTFGDLAGYAIAEVRKEMDRKLEIRSLPTKGLKIYTTLDHGLQKSVSQAFAAHLAAHLAPTPSHYRVEGALVALDPESGGIRALQGGSRFSLTEFNRGMMTRRPLLGLFAPFIYASGIDRGYRVTTPVDVQLLDLAAGTGAGAGAGARPSSAPPIYRALLEGDLAAATTLLGALGLKSVARFSHDLGFRFRSFDLRAGQGVGKASPLQVASAYAAIGSGGHKTHPHLITRIEGDDGTVLYRRPQTEPPLLIRRGTAGILWNLLQQNIASGGARDLRAHQRKLPDLAAATSVASDSKNAWLATLQPGLAVALWLGAERGVSRIAPDPRATRERIAALWGDGIVASGFVPPTAIANPQTGLSFYPVRTAPVGREKVGREKVGREKVGREKVGREKVGREKVGREKVGREKVGRGKAGPVLALPFEPGRGPHQSAL